ncbi:MAG: PorT family protein [Bacteroidetes bacterium]|nr:PorT family protein [Bacteroidota bacterium]
MKTLKIISAFIVAMFFTNLTMAQVEDTETDTTTVDAMSTASLFDKNYSSGLGDKISSPLQETVIPSITGFHIGLRYMPTFSDLDFAVENGEVEAGGELNHGFGLSLNYYFTNFFGTHLEINYTGFEYTFRDGDQETRVNINYINIPLLASYNTNLGRRVNWNLHAGPYLGINTGANLTTEDVGTTNGTTTGTTTGVIHVRPADIGVAYGTGLDFGFGQTQWFHIRVGYRGSAGLIELSDNDATIDNDQFNVVLTRSRLITNGAYIGVMFKL